jgi:hypothetical protein
VLIDVASDDTGRAQARAAWQADDVDGVTRLTTDATAGDFVDVEIDGVENDYDFTASAVQIVERFRMPARPVRAGRVLPVTTTAGSFGR